MCVVLIFHHLQNTTRPLAISLELVMSATKKPQRHSLGICGSLIPSCADVRAIGAGQKQAPNFATSAL
jgi:hypothetical protein